MSDDRVRVRLVPKNSQRASLRDHISLLTASNLRDFEPDLWFTNNALQAVDSIGIKAVETAGNSITGLITKADFEKNFAAKLVETKPEKREFSARSVTTQSFLQPQGEIRVPETLANSIDFAYIPTPPEFYAINWIPPQAAVYHLRIEDAARVLRAYRCHRLGWTGRGVRVAMADTGFAKHDFFDHYGFNITRVTTSSLTNPAEDLSGHGTGESANALVVAPDCIFFGIKHDDYSAEALETSIAQNPKVITNSWGWDIDYQSKDSLRTTNPNLYSELVDVERIIKDAINSGITMVFSGGNGQKAFPGSMPEVISVGGVSVAADGSLSASSYASSYVSQLYPNRGIPDFCGIVGQSGSSKPYKGHIMLPVSNNSELEGDNMIPSQNKKGWGIFSGTSAAAPQVAGIIALVLSANPNLTPSQIKGILSATATDVQTGKSGHGSSAGTGIDLATGTGVVNALNACLRAKQLLDG